MRCAITRATIAGVSVTWYTWLEQAREIRVSRQVLNSLVHALGLDEVDHKVLRTIIEKYDGGPVGIETIAASISEEGDTIMDVYEPYLMQVGFLQRTSRGRVATPSFLWKRQPCGSARHSRAS